MKSITFFLFLFFLSFTHYGQAQADILDNPDRFLEGRNKANPGQSSESFRPQKRVVSISDTTFLISASILMNLDADAYKLTFSLSQEADSLLECTRIIDQKIARFLNDLKKFGIDNDDVYIDIITQYPIYDYDIERKSAVQQQVGYEINKNVIIRFDSLSSLKDLMNAAARNEIHNAVKLDYILLDVNSVYDHLFSEAINIIDKKRALYLKATNLKIEEQAVVFSEQFQFVFPNQLYKGYQAYGSSNLEFNRYRSKGYIEEERKKTTRYYDPINYSGFDQYINPNKISVGLQAVFELQIKYSILRK
ncbi:MAG: SIMPL domain-containing protein [Bacteroidetes bacterium]|nr:SIMPL domain-containing protein [Bacteroidota bacterium]MCB0845192.1 SIMPL domain-containing protein [Bacteroidota bacterium]